MNPVKIPIKQYSVNIKEMSQKIVNRGFFKEYCDCRLRYSLDSALAINKTNPSKINKVLSDVNTKIKQSQNSVLGTMSLIPTVLGTFFFFLVLGTLCSTFENMSFWY